MEYAKGGLRPVRRPQRANGTYHSRTLKPAKKISDIVVWFGVPLLLLVVSAVVLCLVYMRNTKNEHSAKTYQQYAERESTRVRQSSESDDVEQEVRQVVKKIKRLPPKTAERMLYEYLEGLNRLGLSQEELKTVKRIIYDELRR